MAKVRLFDNSGYALNVNLKGLEFNATKNSYGAYGIKRVDLEAVGMSTNMFPEDTVYFCSSNLEVLED